MSLPAQYVQEAWQSAEFWANKILIEFRVTESAQVSWVRGLQELIGQLKAYVQAHHGTGPAWNPAGQPFTVASPASTSSATSGRQPKSAPAPSVPVNPVMAKLGCSAAAAAVSLQEGLLPKLRAKVPRVGARGPLPPPPPAAGSLLERKQPASTAAPGGAPPAVGLGAVFSEISAQVATCFSSI